MVIPARHAVGIQSDFLRRRCGDAGQEVVEFACLGTGIARHHLSGKLDQPARLVLEYADVAADNPIVAGRGKIGVFKTSVGLAETCVGVLAQVGVSGFKDIGTVQIALDGVTGNNDFKFVVRVKRN
jgi:hypothetical protein